jgi:pimeloyl-ACP methyl ester carboxylesterase
MPHIDRDGVGIFYEVTGSGPTTILLSHGYSANTEMWAGHTGALADAGGGHTVVTWDMRGHGQSDAPTDLALYTAAATIEDMVAVLDEVGAQQAVIGGLSLGGYMSLLFNLEHADRVAALMLFDTGPGFRKDEARDQWNANAIRTGDRLGGGLARAARGMLQQQDARVIESLPTIAVPTLVLVGENDAPFHAGTDYMAAKIPGATKVVIAGAGHAANIDQPDAFNAAVIDFLASVS